MRKIAAFALLVLCACNEVIEKHDETMDADMDGAIYTLDCESRNAGVYYHLWYHDGDGDGHGDPSTLVDSCEAPEDSGAWVRVGDDCDDTNGEAHELRSGSLDGDSDGYGVGDAVTVCDATTTLAAAAGDCDDVDPAVNPAAAEVCGNAADDNCDALPDCENLDGDVEITERGARLTGVSAEGLGVALVSAGDINGDGDGDLILGAPGDDGVVYALLGPVGAEGTATEMASARLLGEDRASAGTALSGLGDVDGDGYDDFLVGSPEAGEGGSAYLVPGPIRAVSDEDDDAALELGRDVVKLATDEEAVSLGWALAGPGDLLGEDGAADMVIGAPEASEGSGAVWVSDGLIGEDMIVEDEAIRIDGQAFSGLGTTMAPLQDIDGDGVSELALGAPGYGVTEMYSPWHAPDPLGAVYIVSQVEDARVGGLADAEIVGAEAKIEFASVLGDAGDMNGDGYGDLLVSAPKADHNAGTAWLFSGAVLAEGGDISLDDAMAVVEGEEEEMGLGTSLTSAGDLNMDGEMDLLIGAAWTRLDRLEKVGAVTVWYGPVSGNLSSDAADALLLGDGSQSGQFGYASAVTPDGTLAISAPMMEFGDDDDSSGAEGPFGGMHDMDAFDTSLWGRGSETWGDGAVYFLHAGY